RDRHLHVFRMRTVAVRTEYRGAVEAHLRPAGAAVLAGAAAGVVMVHHALPDARLLLGNARAERDHHAAGLVPGDHGLRAARKARGGVARLEARAIHVQVRATHARGLDLEHDIARPRRRIGKLAQRELAVTEEGYAEHGRAPTCDPVLPCITSVARM